MGYEHNGERYDTLTMAGCADCTVTGNSVISFNRERPVIRLGAGRDTGEKCRHNNDVTLNKVLPSTGYEEELDQAAGDRRLLNAAHLWPDHRTADDAGGGHRRRARLHARGWRRSAQRECPCTCLSLSLIAAACAIPGLRPGLSRIISASSIIRAT